MQASQETVYLFVNTKSQLSTLEAGRVVPVAADARVLPCTPTHPGVQVSLATQDRDVTQQFGWDPRIGFTGPISQAGIE